MTKAKELEAVAKGEGCLGRSQDDEPVFILVARDQLSSDAVREWARLFLKLRMDLGAWDDRAAAKYAEAVRCADDMAAWRDAHKGGKVPD